MPRKPATLNRLSWELQAHKDRIDFLRDNQSPQILGEMKARMERVKFLTDKIAEMIEAKRERRRARMQRALITANPLALSW